MKTIPPAAPRWISVGGGKGGIGKSLIAANLGAAMARMGQRVVLVDADLGGANLHTLLGVERLGPTVRALFAGEISSLAEAVVATPIEGLHLVSGSAAMPGIADINLADRERLYDQIRALDADVVIVDVGAGAGQLVVDCFNLADLRLVALNPQITAIHSTYAFLKAAVYRAIRAIATDEDEHRMLAQAMAGPESSRLGDWLVKVWEKSPSFAARIVRTVDHFGARFVGNQMLSAAEEGTFQGVSRMVRDLLGVNAPVIGSLCASRSVHESVDRRTPFVLSDDHENGARTLVEVAETLLAEDVVALRSARGVPSPIARLLEEKIGLDLTLPRSAYANYLRKHERREVSWRAMLDRSGVVELVQVREVSLGGALLQYDKPIDVGDHGNLIFADLPGHPAVPVEVRHVRGVDALAGVQFLVEGDLPAQLMAAAAPRRARRAKQLQSA